MCLPGWRWLLHRLGRLESRRLCRVRLRRRHGLLEQGPLRCERLLRLLRFRRHLARLVGRDLGRRSEGRNRRRSRSRFPWRRRWLRFRLRLLQGDVDRRIGQRQAGFVQRDSPQRQRHQGMQQDREHQRRRRHAAGAKSERGNADVAGHRYFPPTSVNELACRLFAGRGSRPRRGRRRRSEDSASSNDPTARLAGCRRGVGPLRRCARGSRGLSATPDCWAWKATGAAATGRGRTRHRPRRACGRDR